MKSVYIFGAKDSHYKIGVSQDVERRLQQIRVGNVYVKIIYQSIQIQNAYRIESILHNKYKEFAIGKEWFIFDNIKKVIDDIDSLVNRFGVKQQEEKEICYDNIFGNVCQEIKLETEQMKKENERLERFLYCILGLEQEGDYTNIVYGAVFGKSALQLRQEYGITKKENLRDYFAPEELQAIQSKEMLVSSLIDCGWGYGQIKAFVEQNTIREIA